MLKAWVSLWRNGLRFQTPTPKKEYWLGIFMNMLIMYLGAVPFALLLKVLAVDFVIPTIVYIATFSLPLIPLYFRRAKDANFSAYFTFLFFFCLPLCCYIIVGLLPTQKKENIVIYYLKPNNPLENQTHF